VSVGPRVNRPAGAGRFSSHWSMPNSSCPAVMLISPLRPSATSTHLGAHALMSRAMFCRASAGGTQNDTGVAFPAAYLPCKAVVRRRQRKRRLSQSGNIDALRVRY